ncbi:MAG TPA: hypothetical protein VGC46_01610 [Allosphingosinicella sp.]|jgi:hypothetical protein
MKNRNSAPAKKAEWRKPEVRKMRAGSAEAAGTTVADGAIAQS